MSPRNVTQRVPLDDGREIFVHVNRRGCKGRWTKKDAEMMAELVKAVHAHYAQPTAPLHAAELAVPMLIVPQVRASHPGDPQTGENA